MPAGDSMPDTYIAIMLQSLKKKEQVLDEKYGICGESFPWGDGETIASAICPLS